MTSGVMTPVPMCRHAIFQAKLAENVQTSGTTWVKIKWSPMINNGFTCTPSGTKIFADRAGKYPVDVDLLASYSLDQEVHYVRLLKNGVVDTNSERRHHTSDVPGNGDCVHMSYTVELDADDYIEIEARFSADDPPAYWAHFLSGIRIIGIF